MLSVRDRSFIHQMTVSRNDAYIWIGVLFVYVPWSLNKVSEFADSLSKVISKHVWLAAKSLAAQSESETSVQQDLFNKYFQRLIAWLLWGQVLVFDSSTRLKGWSKCNATEGGEEHFVTSRVVVKWLPATKLMGGLQCASQESWLCGWSSSVQPALLPQRPFCAGVPGWELGRTRSHTARHFHWFGPQKGRRHMEVDTLSPPSYSGSRGETFQPGRMTPFPLPWGCGGHSSFSGLVPCSSAISLSLTEWFLLLKNIFVSAF